MLIQILVKGSSLVKMERNDAADEMSKALGEMEGLLSETQVVVFTAPVCCGKSTITPRHSAEMDRDTGLKVVCTRPRRIAATSLAKHVAHGMETNERDGFVSYKIRYDDTTNSSTRLVFMTDGAVFSELNKSDGLASYSAVVIDAVIEAGALYFFSSPRFLTIATSSPRCCSPRPCRRL